MLKKFTTSAKNLMNVRGIVLTAMLLALHAVLGIIKIPVPPAALENRLTLTFVASSVAGIVLGPVPAMLVGGLGDVLGFLLNPGGGAYFPGFTVSAMLGGLIYGLFLYKRDKSTARLWLTVNVYRKGEKRSEFDITRLIFVIIACAVVTVFINVVLNTVWLAVMYKKAYHIFTAARIIKNAVVYPLHVIIIFSMYMFIDRAGLTKKYL